MKRKLSKPKNPKRLSKNADLSWENDMFWLNYGVDLEARKIMISESIDEDSVNFYIRAIHKMEENSISPIKIYISTYGGDVYEAFALYDAIVMSKCPVEAYCTGKVMSAGTIILCAADKRYATQLTTFMFHTVSSDGTDGGKLFEDVVNVEETKRLWSKMLDIYAERTNEKRSYYLRWLKYEDRYITSDKAVEMGFIHEVI